MSLERNVLKWIGRAVLVATLLAMYAPVFMIFLYSFNESRIGSVWTGFSFDGYEQLWDDAELWRGLRTSCIVGASVGTLSLALAVPAAMAVRRWGRRAKGAAMAVFAVPLVVPDIIIAVSLALFFHAIGMQQGYLTVILAHATFGVSYAFVVVAGAAADLDDTLHEAALDCGATPWQAFWRVTMPALVPSLLVAWLFVFALSFDEFLITFMTKGPGADTLPIEIYSRMRFGVRPNTNALFVVLFLATLLLAAIAARLGKRRDLWT